MLKTQTRLGTASSRSFSLTRAGQANSLFWVVSRFVSIALYPFYIEDFEFFFAKMLLSTEDIKNMIGNEDNQDEVNFKVADRRKFNPDGSVKEGVVLDAEKVKEKPAEQPKAEIESKTHDLADSAEQEVPFQDGPDDNEIPGAEDPASFVNFLSTLATNAAAALGAVPHPATGKRTLDLETGKYWLDILGMIKDKTSGNLHPQESRLLDGLLGDLRMQYVQLVKATEERLKAQAAQQFSGADILGKK